MHKIVGVACVAAWVCAGQVSGAVTASGWGTASTDNCATSYDFGVDVTMNLEPAPPGLVIVSASGHDDSIPEPAGVAVGAAVLLRRR